MRKPNIPRNKTSDNNIAMVQFLFLRQRYLFSRFVMIREQKAKKAQTVKVSDACGRLNLRKEHAYPRAV